MNEDNSKRRLGRGLAALIGEMDQLPTADVGAQPAVNPDRLVPIEFVGRNLREVPGVAGRALPPRTRETDGVHVIVRGTFVVNGASRGPGEYFGGESLFGGDPRRVEVRAETDALALFVPADDILTCARIYPEVALELLRRKLTPAA